MQMRGVQKSKNLRTSFKYGPLRSSSACRVTHHSKKHPPPPQRAAALTIKFANAESECCRAREGNMGSGNLWMGMGMCNFFNLFQKYSNKSKYDSQIDHGLLPPNLLGTLPSAFAWHTRDRDQREYQGGREARPKSFHKRGEHIYLNVCRAEIS